MVPIQIVVRVRLNLTTGITHPGENSSELFGSNNFREEVNVTNVNLHTSDTLARITLYKCINAEDYHALTRIKNFKISPQGDREG